MESTTIISLTTEVRSALKEKGCAVGGEAWQKALNLDLLIGLLNKGQLEKAKTLLLRKLKTFCSNITTIRNVNH